MKVALVGIVKDEFPYLLEWVAHHKNIGIDKIIIVNLESTDNTNELVEAMDKAGIIDTFFVPWNGWVKPSPLIKRAVKEYAQDCEWFSFMDIDEFFIPNEGFFLKDILASQSANVGAIAFNWATYGSSFQKYPDNFDLRSPVTSRFTWRAAKKFEVNKHFKSFVRKDAFANTDGAYKYFHFAELLPNYIYTNSMGEPLEVKCGFLETVSWEKARINHYVLKSKWEYIQKKAQKGLDKGGFNRDWQFFKHHDRNDVFEPMPQYLQQQRDSQINNLKQELLKIGYVYPERQKIDSKQNLDFQSQFEKCSMEFAQRNEYNSIEFNGIESILIEGEIVIIKGVSFDENGYSQIHMPQLLLSDGKISVSPTSIESIKRPVFHTIFHHIQPEEKVGFVIKFVFPYEIPGNTKFTIQINEKSYKLPSLIEI